MVDVIDFAPRKANASFIKNTKPMMVLSYDDGKIEDYTKVLPVHREKGVPAVFAPIVSDIGRGGMMTMEQLVEIYNEGHEIASHTWTHTSLATYMGDWYRLTENANAGDTTLKMNIHSWFARYTHNIETKGIIREGNVEETFTVISRTENTSVTLKDPLQNSYTTNAEITHHPDLLIAENAFSKRRLAKHGIHATGMIYPGGGHDKVTRDITSRYYRWGRATWWQNEPNVIDPKQGVNIYALGSEEFAEDAGNNLSLAEMEEMMDEAVETKSLVLFHSHSFYESLTQERIAWMIDTAQEKGIEIVTMSEALNHFGAPNYIGQLDKPDYTNEVIVKVDGNDTTFSVPRRENLYQNPIIQSPDGSFFKITVNDAGEIAANKIYS